MFSNPSDVVCDLQQLRFHVLFRRFDGHRRPQADAKSVPGVGVAGVADPEENRATCVARYIEVIAAPADRPRLLFDEECVHVYAW